MREYILRGYSYRLCVCEEETAPEVVRKEAVLADAQKAIRADVPLPRILASSHLAAWVSQYPALVLTYFHTGNMGNFFDLRTWMINITAATPQFVLADEWRTTQEDLKKYLQFSQDPAEVPFFLKGETGVGKTRLAYETVASAPGAAGLVIYCSEEQAACARYLAMNQHTRAILVADECDVQTRADLKNALGGFKTRVRAVAVNAEAPSRSGAREYFLQQLPSSDVAEVLKANFSEVPEVNRWRYAELSEGFIGLAADMCRYHPSIQAAGDLGPVMQSVEEYYHLRLPEEQRRNVEAIALVSRVGFKGEQESELGDLCKICGLDKNELKDIAWRVHTVPGFVGIGGPYLYVRPQIIARVAFGEAWARWARHDQDGFLRNIPSSLLDQFRERVNKSAVEEVRGVTAGFFRGWVGRLGPGDLHEERTSEKLCILVETRPEEFLPQLRSIVERATKEELQQVKGEWWGGAWGPRRSLVWLCERLAAFSEYFADVELILLKLAVAESEPSISNNATHIWKQLFRIALSGTPIPFDSRLMVLKSRVYSQDHQISALGLDALDRALDPFASRTGGPLVVAGRIPPPEWTPTGEEARNALSNAVTLLAEFARSDRSDIHRKAIEIALSNFHNLLGRGFLAQLQSIFDPKLLNDEVRARVVNVIEHSLYLQSDFSPADRKWPSSYVEQIQEWSTSLAPTGPTGRLLTVLSVGEWQFTGERKEQWLEEVRAIARILFESSEIFNKQFGSLFSDSAKSAGYLGEEIGKLDRNGNLLEQIIEGVVKYRNSTFARGYIFGYISHEDADLKRMNQLIDAVQDQDAQLAYELFIMGGRAAKATERALRLVEAGKLSVRHFRALALGWRGTALGKEEITAIVELLLGRISKGDVQAAEVAIDVVADNCLERTSPSAGSLKTDFVDLAWKVVEATALNPGRESVWWGKLLDLLVPHDLHRAANIAASSLLGEGLMQDEEAGKILQEIAKKDPAAAVEALGSAMMDEKGGWRFSVGKFDFVAQLPAQAIADWVDRHGVEAARMLAAQLPPPYLGANGDPIVPPLTEHLLAKFEDDEQVFRRFAAGVHNFQSYMGDIAAQHLHEAEIAKHFLGHRLRRIREWANIEVMEAEAQAKYWTEFEEEQKSRY